MERQPGYEAPDAEDDLRAQLAQMRLVTDAAPLLISYVDSTLRYRFANKAYADWFGAPAGGVVGRHVAEVVGDEAFQTLRPYVESALAGQHVVYEALVNYTGGGPRFVHTELVPDKDAWDTVCGFTAIISDISERRRTETILRQQSLAFENMYDALIITDIAGRITDCNPAFTTLYGYAKEEALGQSTAMLHRPEDQASLTASMLETVAGDGRWTGEVRFIRKDGKEGICETSVVPMRDAEGRVTGAVGANRDITARKRAQDEAFQLLKDAQDTAKRQQAFLKDVLLSATEGKLHLISDAGALPPLLAHAGEVIMLTDTGGLSELRHELRSAAIAQGFSDDRWQDAISAAGEAGMNAIVHGGGGRAQVSTNPRGTVQVRIEDYGTGIAMENLPRAALARGFSTKATLGHGLKMVLETIDRLYLLTGPAGTTVVLEQDQTKPLPAWL